jgi:hypothetical protein
MLSPLELVNAIVSNNPPAVHQNLINMGMVNQQYQSTPDSFMQLLTNLPKEIVQTRQQAKEFVSNALDIPINNNGPAATYLWGIQQQYNLTLRNIVQNTFDSSLPRTVDEGQPIKACSCSNASTKGLDNQKWIMLVLAFLGLIFLLILISKLISKVF